MTSLRDGNNGIPAVEKVEMTFLSLVDGNNGTVAERSDALSLRSVSLSNLSKCRTIPAVEKSEMTFLSLVGGTTKQSIRAYCIWIASFLAMTNLVTSSLRGTKQSRYKRLNLDCFVPRNDGDLYRHHSFLQGIFPIPGSRNDDAPKEK